MRANAGLPVAPHGLRSPDVPPCQRGEQLPRPEPLRAWPSAHSFELRTGLQPLLDLQGPDRWRTEQVRHLTMAAGGSSNPHGGRPAGEAAVFLGSGAGHENVGFDDADGKREDDLAGSVRCNREPLSVTTQEVVADVRGQFEDGRIVRMEYFARWAEVFA